MQGLFLSSYCSPNIWKFGNILQSTFTGSYLENKDYGVYLINAIQLLLPDCLRDERFKFIDTTYDIYWRQVEGGMKIASFKDPDGVLIELVEHPEQ